MPDDDALIGQGIVDERNEARRPGLMFGSDGSIIGEKSISDREFLAPLLDDDPTTYADEHEGGQLRIAVAGEQVPLLPLPDAAIPTTDEPQAVDELERPAETVEAPFVGRLAALHRQRVEGHTSRRERLERKAEKRREWAESRARKAAAAHARVHEIADGIPFGQPILVGHHSEGRHRRDVARIENGMRASIDHARQADKHEQKADGLESQLRGAIYSDDADAVERLEEKLARLEQQRETMKARNAAYRKEHRAELKTMGAYERGQAVPHASYELQNLGGNITRTRERLEQLKRAAVIVAQGGRGRGRPMLARFASDCAECAGRMEKGESIVYYKLTREAVHAACDNKGA